MTCVIAASAVADMRYFALNYGIYGATYDAMTFGTNSYSNV